MGWYGGRGVLKAEVGVSKEEGAEDGVGCWIQAAGCEGGEGEWDEGDRDRSFGDPVG